MKIKFPHSICLRAAILLPMLTAMWVNGQTTGSTPAKQGSTVFNFDKLARKTTQVGERRDVADLPTTTLEKFECHISTLLPGRMSHPPHHHAQEEFIILKEGTLDVFINGKVQRVGPGSLFFFASNDMHNVTNVGETGVRREILNTPTVTCANLEGHVTTLNPGEIPHLPHHHPDEELVVVKEGLMQATIKGIAEPVAGPGSIFFYASNDEHGMKNVGNTPASYYVFRIITAATPKVASN